LPEAEADGAPAYPWPVEARQWRQLAATLARRHPTQTAVPPPTEGESAPRQTWRLRVNAPPDAPEVRALATLLRNSLPPGAELAVEIDTGIPDGFASLAPPGQ
jgi:hypothetical protein